MTKFPHRVELEIPLKDMVMVTIGGYKFFRGGIDSNQFQCVTCLCLMGTQTLSGEKVDGQVRRLKLVKDCDCPPQK